LRCRGRLRILLSGQNSNGNTSQKQQQANPRA
jgi:hypothetical protein